MFNKEEHNKIQLQLDKYINYPAGKLNNDEIELIKTFNDIPTSYPSFMSGFILGCLFAKKEL